MFYFELRNVISIPCILSIHGNGKREFVLTKMT